MNRRNFAATAVGGAAVIGLASCALSNGSVVIPPKVEQVIADIQPWMPWVQATLMGIAVLQPSTAPLLATAESYITAVSSSLNTMSSTMTTAEAKPVVKQVMAGMDGTLKVADQMIAAMPASPAQTKYRAMLAEAKAILPLLEAFVTGTQAVVGGPLTPVRPVHLYIREVA